MTIDGSTRHGRAGLTAALLLDIQLADQQGSKHLGSRCKETVMTSRRTTQRLTRVIIAAAVTLLVAFVVCLTVLAQKRAERRDYEAVLAGTPCKAVAHAPDYVARAALKSLTFGGAELQYLRGDADCQTVRPGRLVNDTEVPFCLFDRPGFVEVTIGATKASYVIAVGQASILVAPDGFRCAVKPSP